MIKKFLFVLLLTSCTDENRTLSVLEAQGYTDVETTGHSWNSCGEGDYSCTGFSALSPNGTRVRGAVGCGKGCTIRFE